MKDLSRRQQAILQFIERFLDDNDYPPTIRDIQSELDISSTCRRLQPQGARESRIDSPQ